MNGAEYSAPLEHMRTSFREIPYIVKLSLLAFYAAIDEGHSKVFDKLSDQEKKYYQIDVLERYL